MSRPDDVTPPLSLGSRLRRGGRRDADAEQVVTGTPYDVWKIVSDVERIGEWWPRAVAGRVIDGEEAGREQVVRLDWGRAEGVVRQRVTQWDPPRRYAWHVESEAMGDKPLAPLADVTVTVEIRPEAGVSRVTIGAAFLPAGARGALAMRQVVRAARRTYRQALKSLERVLTG